MLKPGLKSSMIPPYISASDTSASYPKQVFRNYGEIKYLGKISTGRISEKGLIGLYNDF